ncbi:MAG TPA: UBP-type zinc finger domain-containing protein [Polyangia bacterium]
MSKSAVCSHMGTIAPHVRPHTKGCEECLAMGDTWVHLRLCMACGHVGCCDDSKNKHATKHFHAHKDHPLIRSLEPGEEWGWCYVDDLFIDNLPIPR